MPMSFAIYWISTLQYLYIHMFKTINPGSLIFFFVQRRYIRWRSINPERNHAKLKIATFVQLVPVSTILRPYEKWLEQPVSDKSFPVNFYSIFSFLLDESLYYSSIKFIIYLYIFPWLWGSRGVRLCITCRTKSRYSVD